MCCLHECSQICLKSVYPLIKDQSQQEPQTVLCTLLPAHRFGVQDVLHPAQTVCWSPPALELQSQHELCCGFPAHCIETSQVPQPKDPHHAMLGGLSASAHQGKAPINPNTVSCTEIINQQLPLNIMKCKSQNPLLPH